MTQWWKNPFKFLDSEDLYSDNPKDKAAAFFRDMIADRPTEFTVFMAMFLRAYYNLDEVQAKLTQRQTVAVGYAIDAIGQGVNPARYVSDSLDISFQAAYQLLNRADKKVRMLNFADLVDYGTSDTSLDWFPAAKDIQRKMASMPKRCATHGTTDCLGTTRGDHVLCWNCFSKYKLEGERPEWVNAEIKALKAEHRQTAINELYKEYRRSRPETHGTDYDEMAEAS